VLGIDGIGDGIGPHGDQGDPSQRER